MVYIASQKNIIGLLHSDAQNYVLKILIATKGACLSVRIQLLFRSWHRFSFAASLHCSCFVVCSDSKITQWTSMAKLMWLSEEDTVTRLLFRTTSWVVDCGRVEVEVDKDETNWSMWGSLHVGPGLDPHFLPFWCTGALSSLHLLACGKRHRDQEARQKHTKSCRSLKDTI